MRSQDGRSPIIPRTAHGSPRLLGTANPQLSVRIPGSPLGVGPGRALRCSRGVVTVHSFGGHADDKSRTDYRRFAEAMACVPAFNALAAVGRRIRVPLLIGWLADTAASPETVARAL